MVLIANNTGWQKWLIACWAFLECMLFGGLIYGWATLVFVLKAEGIYADLCPVKANAPNDSASLLLHESTTATMADSITGQSLAHIYSTTLNTTNTNKGPKTHKEKDGNFCEPQDERMALCFTIASAVTCLSCVVMGHFNYKFGTRFSRLVAFVSFVGGTLMMAFVSIDVPWLMFPGLTLLGVGGVPLLVTDVQISNLFRKGSAAIVGFLNGGFNLSSAVLLLVKVAHEEGMSRQNLFLITAGLHSLTLVCTFCFLPKMFIPDRLAKPVEEIAIEDIEKTADQNTEKDMENNLATDSERNSIHIHEQSTTPSVLRCIASPLFLMHCFWLSVLQLRYHYYLSSLNTYLNRILDGNKDEVSHFTDVFAYAMIGNLFASILPGLIYDWQKKLCKEGKTALYREAKPAVLPLAACSIVFIVLSVISMIPSKALVYVSFICVVFARCFLYTLAQAFLSAVIPIEYFGFLFGVMLVVGGSISFLQYAFFSWSVAYPEGPLHADICLFLLVLISGVHPLYVWIKCKREEGNVSDAKPAHL